MENSHRVGDQNLSFYLKIKNVLNFPKLFPNIVDIMPESNATFFFILVIFPIMKGNTTQHYFLYLYE